MLIPNNLLSNKNVLLGVSGSIAVYKSLEIIRLLTKAGANVRVVMSESSKKFVTPLSFETLTSNQVLDDTNESWVSDHNHIKITDWADLFVIAPATANTIAKLSHALADTILLQCALAYKGKKLLAPSANTNMIENPLTQANLQTLLNTDYTIIATQTKELACKTLGDGAMAEPLDIFWTCAKALLKNKFWTNRAVLVTGGGTIEKIDDVRYISNFSSGKMASSLSTALYCMGANVSLIATKFEDNIPKNIDVIKVESSNSMLKALQNSLSLVSTNEKKPYLFMVAAVSDYVPKTFQGGKLKKEVLGHSFDLSLSQGVDILSSIDKKNIITIGFKAEMDKEKAHFNASQILKNKNVDAVCLNILENSSSFGLDTNKIDFITQNNTKSIPRTDKINLCFNILKYSENI